MKLRLLSLKSVLKKIVCVGIVTFLFSCAPLSLTSSTTLYAQTGPSIAGDSVCGGVTYNDKGEAQLHPCKIQDLGKVVKGLLSLVISIGLPLLVFIIAFRFFKAWKALVDGNPNAYKEELKKVGNAVFGFVIIVLMIGGFFTVALRFFGVNETILKFIENILASSSSGLVEHAYAANQQYLPNFLTVNNLYDFILNILRLTMRFFVYPALIVIWVFTGFSFIYAQGNPEQLTKAKKWLVGAFITTLAIFMVQTFLIAIRGSVQNILPGGTPGSSVTPGSSGISLSSAVVAKQTTAEKSLAQCIKGGTQASACASQYASAGGLGDPMQAIAKQAYTSCVNELKKAKAVCNSVFKEKGGTGSPAAGPLDQAANCGEGFTYSTDSNGCTSICGRGFEYSPDSKGCKSTTTGESDTGSGDTAQSDTGTNANEDTSSGKGDLTPINPNEVTPPSTEEPASEPTKGAGTEVPEEPAPDGENH
jgi:hypothetical protein